MKNPLSEYFFHKANRVIYKWHHYFDIYHRHLQNKRDLENSIHFLEIGIYQGGSIEMWNEYFGGSRKILIYGIDNDERCKQLENDFTNVQIFVGDQADPDFLQKVVKDIPQLDVIIDDGGHTMQQQITSFEYLYPHLVEDGIYICEDIHTSYWEEYGGGYKKEDTFIEYIKNHIDKLNAFHSRDNLLTVDEFTTCTNSIHFYDSICVIEKQKREYPVVSKRGHKLLHSSY